MSNVSPTSGSIASRELFRDAILYAVSKAVPGILGLLSVAVYIRLIGPEQFGLFSILMAAVSMWSSFASGWFYQGILRYYSGWGATRPEWWRFLGTGLAISMLIYVGVFLANLPWLGVPVSLLDVVLCLVLGIAIMGQVVGVSCWQSELQPLAVVRVELVRTIATFAIACALAYWIRPHAGAILAGTALGYAGSVLFGRPLSAIFVTETGRIAPSLAQAWRFGWPVSLWLLVQLSFPWLDRVMIQSYLGLHDTGVFASLSEVLTRSFSLLVYPVTIAAYPRLSQHWNRGDRAAAQRLLVQALLAACGIAVICVAGLHLVRNSLVPIILPATARELPSAHPELVALIAAGGAAWQLALLAHKPLELASRTRVMLVLIAGAFLLKLAINYYSLPHWGVVGVAYATIISGLGYSAGCMLLARQQRSRQ